MTNDEALSSCPNVQIKYVTCSIMRAYRMVVYKLQLSRILQLPYRITAGYELENGPFSNTFISEKQAIFHFAVLQTVLMYCYCYH